MVIGKLHLWIILQYMENFWSQDEFNSLSFFKPKEKFIKVGEVNILAPEDIAVMKIIAISQRGKKRDFIDLYWLCKNTKSLFEIINNVPKQYKANQNLSHILKSLIFLLMLKMTQCQRYFLKLLGLKSKNSLKKKCL